MLPGDIIRWRRWSNLTILKSFRRISAKSLVHFLFYSFNATYYITWQRLNYKVDNNVINVSIVFVQGLSLSYALYLCWMHYSAQFLWNIKKLMLLRSQRPFVCRAPQIFDVKIEMHFDFVSGAPKFSGVPLLIVIKRAEIVKTANTVHVAWLQIFVYSILLYRPSLVFNFKLILTVQALHS